MRMRFYSKSWLQLLGAWLLLCSAGLVEAGIETTKHNLSATSGIATHRATSEERICLMCHTPHNSDPAGPLWNHKLSGATYTPYSSSTLNAAPGQPTGSSKLCLACHDGTIAVGALLNMPGAVQGYTGMGDPFYDGTIPGLENMITGAANLGIDLSDDHPISFVYDLALAGYSLELNDPAVLTAEVRLDGNNELQCTSCHDPHDDTNTKFLRKGFTEGGFGSPLCIECHNKDGWGADNQHRESVAEWNGTAPNPWHIDGQNVASDSGSTPKSNGCESCHQPHTAPVAQRLLKQDGESDLCMVCHNGNVTVTYDMDTPYGYTYNHMTDNVSYDGKHAPMRESTNHEVRETSYISESGGPNTLEDDRHAECQDCHNPHWARKGVSPDVDFTPRNGTAWPNQGANGGTAMDVSPVLKGVWGVEPDWSGAPASGDWDNSVGDWPGTYTESFTEVDSVDYQYQLCLKCHSYYAYGDTPPDDPWNNYDWSEQDDDAGGPLNPVPRWNGSQTDQAMEFNTNNPSFHPVGGKADGNNDFKMNAGAIDYKASLVDYLTPDSTMGCVDCHYNSNASYVTTGLAKGPHGSETWPILGAPYDESTGQTSPNSSDHLCFNCHKKGVYGGDTSCDETDGTAWQQTGFSNGLVASPTDKNLHCFHSKVEQVPCVGCHTALPHGWKRPHFLIAYDDTSPYNAHARAKWPGSSPARYQYGMDSSTNFNTLPGEWAYAVCHTGGAGDVVNCGTLP